MRPIIEDAKPFKIEGVYCRLIPLSHGFHTIVDAADYEWLMQWKWFCWKSKEGNCYARRGDRGRFGFQIQILMQREILGLGYGDRRIGDHIDCGSTLDNRRGNIRIADYSESSANQRKRRNAKWLKGVYHSNRGKKRWKAAIQWRYMRIPLGDFHTEQEAHAAYCEAALKYHGKFARFK